MAIQKNLNTRIRLKYDTYAAWDSKKDTFKPLSGEMCVVYVPQEDNEKLQEEVLLKVGNGESFFKDLPWISAKAADVAAWAKRSDVAITTKTESVVVGEETVNVSVPQLCFNNGYNDGAYTDAITVSLENLFDPRDLTDDLKVLIGNGSIAEAINIVYNAVQAGGTGSVVTVTNNDDANKFTRSLYQGTNNVGTIDFTTADGVIYDKNNKTLKLDLKDTEKLKKSATAIDASQTNLANYDIYPVSLDKDSDLAVAIPVDFNSDVYTVSTYNADDDNKINYVITQGNYGWNAPVSGPEIEINVGSGLQYTKNDKTLKHSAPGTGSALTPEHTDSNTIKAITGVEVDALGHITKVTSANIDTTDDNTTYELRTNEFAEKGVIELYDEVDMASDIITILGDNKKIKVSSDSHDNITIEHLDVTIDKTNSDAVSLEHNNTFEVYTTITADESGHLTAAKKTTFTLPEDRNTITHVVAKSGDPISVTDTPTSDGCDLHYVVGHNAVVKNNSVVNEAQLKHGDEIQVVSDITYDSFGHTSGVTTRKYTLPVHNIIKEDPDTVEEKSEFVSYISEQKDDSGKNTGNIIYHTEPFISVIKADVHNALGEVVEAGTKDSVRAPQTKAIVDYVDKAINSIETEISVATSGAVIIRGTVGNVEADCATISQLSTPSETTVGHAYKVVTDNWVRLDDILHRNDTINHPEFARKGDMLIGYEHIDPDDTSSYRWLYIPAADENVVIGYSSNGGESISYVADTQQVNSLVFVSHEDNLLGVKASLKQDKEDKTKTALSIDLQHLPARDTKEDKTTTATITDNSTFSVIEKIYDDNGHIVSIDTKEITLEESPAFAEIIVDNIDGTAAPKSTETNIVATTPASSLTVSSSNKWVVTGVEDETLYVGHALSGVGAGTKGSTDGTTFKVPSITVDEAGHVTALSEGIALTIPEIPELPEYLPNENPLNFITVLPDGNSSTVAYTGSSSIIVKSDNPDDICLERSSDSSNLVTLDVAKYTAYTSEDQASFKEYGESGVEENNTYNGAKINITKTRPNGTTETALSTIVAGEQDVVKVEHVNRQTSTGPSLIKVSVEDKGISTAKIADHAIGATQIKAEQGYSGDDAEVWVFCCGSATELVD